MLPNYCLQASEETKLSLPKKGEVKGERMRQDTPPCSSQWMQSEFHLDLMGYFMVIFRVDLFYIILCLCINLGANVTYQIKEDLHLVFVVISDIVSLGFISFFRSSRSNICWQRLLPSFLLHHQRTLQWLRLGQDRLPGARNLSPGWLLPSSSSVPTRGLNFFIPSWSGVVPALVFRTCATPERRICQHR